MARTNVYAYAEDQWGQQETSLAGWFNPDSATRYAEATSWDGSNHVSVNTGSEWHHESLFRTAQGRWVKLGWSNYEDQEDRHEFISDDQAKDWLLRNDGDDAVAKWFGELEEESGPNLGGRPAVGAKVESRVPDDVLAALDERAKTEGVARAEMIRRILAASLTTAP